MTETIFETRQNYLLLYLLTKYGSAIFDYHLRFEANKRLTVLTLIFFVV